VVEDLISSGIEDLISSGIEDHAIGPTHVREYFS